MSMLSTALAGIGTVLTALALLAPTRERASTSATISFAPPREPPPVERWSPPQRDAEPLVYEPVVREPAPRWPGLADRRAEGCAPAVRLALIEGLATLETPWANAILRSACDEDPDPAVRGAAQSALRDEC